MLNNHEVVFLVSQPMSAADVPALSFHPQEKPRQEQILNHRVTRLISAGIAPKTENLKEELLVIPLTSVVDVPVQLGQKHAHKHVLETKCHATHWISAGTVLSCTKVDLKNHACP
jgi:hypothetical protein